MKTKTKPENRPIEILLVEDSQGDAVLMREVFKQSRFPIHLNITRNGEDALLFLRQKDPFSHALEPDLILLDLNLPKRDGREVLAEIKRDSDLKHIPLLVLTASQDDEDMRMAYEQHANLYLVKPLRMDHFSVLLKYLEDFWIKTLPQA